MRNWGKTRVRNNEISGEISIWFGYRDEEYRRDSRLSRGREVSCGHTEYQGTWNESHAGRTDS